MTVFQVTISDVSGALFEGGATRLRVPGSEGEMVVLAHHEAIIALLKEGTISLTTEAGEDRTYPVQKGVLEVSNNKAIVLI
jgi:F-type H+-transporting ATPase subunit epsilon